MAKADPIPRRLEGEAPQVFVTPAPDRAVPRPDGLAWPEAGDWLGEDQYVRRRIADGDLIAGWPPSEATEAPEQKKVK